MQETELIPVFVRTENGKTVCICHAGRKKCRQDCERDEVTRDKFKGWEKTIYRNRYGR